MAGIGEECTSELDGLLCSWRNAGKFGKVYFGSSDSGNHVRCTFCVRADIQILDGFLTLMVPYLKSGVRSEYSVQTFVKQKPSVICDIEVVVLPSSEHATVDSLDGNPSKIVLHQYSSLFCYTLVSFIFFCPTAAISSVLLL